MGESEITPSRMPVDPRGIVDGRIHGGPDRALLRTGGLALEQQRRARRGRWCFQR